MAGWVDGDLLTPDNLNGKPEEMFGAVYAKNATFGATGDGTTNDTTAIQAAIDYAEANNLRSVILGRGTFVVNSSLLLSGSNKGIALIGSPFASMQQGSANPVSVIKWTGGASPVISATNSFNHFVGFSVQNFGTATHAVKVLNGGREFFFMVSLAQVTGSTSFSDHCLELNNTNYAYIDRCEFVDAPALKLAGASCTTFYVTRSLFSTNSSSANPYVTITASADVIRFRDNTFNYYAGGPTTAIDMSTTSNTVGILDLEGNEFDGGSVAAQLYICKAKNVNMLTFDRNQVSGFGDVANTVSPITLTSSRAVLKNLGGVSSINKPLCSTLDTSSYVYSYENTQASGVPAPILSTSQSGNLINATISSTDVIIKGDLASGMSDAVYLVTVPDNQNYTAAIAKFDDSSNKGYMTVGQRFTIQVLNSSGGVMGTFAFSGTDFISAGNLTAPANGKYRSVQFIFNGSKAVEIARGAGDVG